MEQAFAPQRLLLLSWVCLAALAGSAWLLHSLTLAVGVLAGGLVSIGSFWFSGRDLRRFLNGVAPPEGTEAVPAGTTTKGLVIRFWLRLLVIGLVLLLLIAVADINIIGLLVGLTTVVITIILAALGVLWDSFFRRR